MFSSPSEPGSSFQSSHFHLPHIHSSQLHLPHSHSPYYHHLPTSPPYLAHSHHLQRIYPTLEFVVGIKNPHQSPAGHYKPSLQSLNLHQLSVLAVLNGILIWLLFEYCMAKMWLKQYKPDMGFSGPFLDCSRVEKRDFVVGL